MKETLDQETRELERAIVDSKAERDRLEAERMREKDMLDKALKLSINDSDEPSAPPQSSPPPKIQVVTPDLC